MQGVTSVVKGYLFELAIPEGFGVSGVVLADQVKSLDWRSRRAEVKERLPAEVTEEVTAKLNALLTQSQFALTRESRRKEEATTALEG